MKNYWARRHQTIHGLRAVGSLDRTEEENERDYSEARALLSGLVRADFPKPSELRVLDLGFGQAHDAHILRELGVRSYTGYDFVAPLPTTFPPSFVFQREDISAPSLALEPGYDLVLLVDVVFHVVADGDFAQLIANVRRARPRMLYVTGLFHDVTLAPHVRHRRIEPFSKLGRVCSIHPWRDTLLARIRCEDEAIEKPIFSARA